MRASPSTARAINDRLALELLQHEGPLTAGQLKTMTGLSRPTVADLVERLQGSGLIRVVGEAGADRRGPNARLYGIVADRAHLAALDVRTESVSVVVADLLGTRLAEASLPIGGDSEPGPVVQRAAALVERTSRNAGAAALHSVCVGAPGLIDPSTGELRDTTGLPAWHRMLVAALQQRLPARVIVENETNLAAVAEQRLGAAGDRESFAFLWLGQGVGAGIVLDGRLRRGASGGAGEIGFLPVPGTAGTPSAVDCAGGFHSLAGAAAIRELGERYGLLGETAAGVVAAAVAKDRGDFLDALADRLALGAAAVAAVLDPGCVVLGGETGHAGGEALASRVESRVAALSPLPTQVRAGVLGDAAVLSGALLTAGESARGELFG
ncbi:ROK family transcriptional regulator [Streptomyces sp. V1I6]|uniref:ROK family transcriptional regulator n=1 Tax=Streptomyces sp. V1I6 TaxID=3042273 RepID=UPI0027873B30|nr:ROK family transcriptional regulator [Streptomyces sp. V1I6]MDQ0841526.1 putative NBD/HSP70 family sugar kinase [Streptomyces sp. V1I6]